MRALHLHVKGEYFDRIKFGKKTEEYRRFNSYWTARLNMRSYDEVHILRGYPRKMDPERTIIFPWNSYYIKKITHKEFGEEPVDVYAIRLSHSKLDRCEKVHHQPCCDPEELLGLETGAVWASDLYTC